MSSRLCIYLSFMLYLAGKFYSMCENSETFVSLTDHVSIIIDGQYANVPVCSVKLAAAQRDTRLRYTFKEISLISKDVALSVASGVDDILWRKVKNKQLILD